MANPAVGAALASTVVLHLLMVYGLWQLPIPLIIPSMLESRMLRGSRCHSTIGTP
jgi:hypothetical protein